MNYDNTDLGLIGLSIIAVVSLLIGFWRPEGFTITSACLPAIVGLARLKENR